MGRSLGTAASDAITTSPCSLIAASLLKATTIKPKRLSEDVCGCSFFWTSFAFYVRFLRAVLPPKKVFGSLPFLRAWGLEAKVGGLLQMGLNACETGAQWQLAMKLAGHKRHSAEYGEVATLVAGRSQNAFLLVFKQVVTQSKCFVLAVKWWFFVCFSLEMSTCLDSPILLRCFRTFAIFGNGMLLRMLNFCYFFLRNCKSQQSLLDRQCPLMPNNFPRSDTALNIKP